MLPSLIPYRKGNKWGFCDKNKNVIIDCIYDKVRPFYEGLAAVSQGNYSWGFIDIQGKEVVGCFYDKVFPFNCGHTLVSEGDWTDKYIVNNYGEKLQLGKKYKLVSPFVNGVACVGENNFLGNIIMRGEHTSLIETGEKLKSIKNDDLQILKIKFIDFLGNELNTIKFLCDEEDKLIKSDLTNMHAPFFFVNDRMVNIYLDKDISISLTDNDRIYYFNEGLAQMRNEADLIGYRNYLGKPVLPCKYTYASHFKNGRAVVKEQNLYKLIDIRGQVLKVFPKNIKPFPIHNDTFIVKEKVSYSYKEYYDVGLYNNRSVTEHKYGVINLAGDVIVPLHYDSTVLVKDNLIMLMKESGYRGCETEYCFDINGTQFWED